MPVVLGDRAWGGDDGFFSIGEGDGPAGTGQEITKGYSVPEGFDSLWIEVAGTVTRLSNPWLPHPSTEGADLDQNVPAPGFLIDGTTPAWITCQCQLQTATGANAVSIVLVGVNQAYLVDNTVRLAVVLDVAISGDTNSRAKLLGGSTLYSTAHGFGVVAVFPNVTSPPVLVVPGPAATRRRATLAQTGVEASTQRPAAEMALLSMADAATDPFAAYDALSEGASLGGDSAIVAVWGPRTLIRAGLNDGDNTGIVGSLAIGSPHGITFPYGGGKIVGRVAV